LPKIRIKNPLGTKGDWQPINKLFYHGSTKKKENEKLSMKTPGGSKQLLKDSSISQLAHPQSSRNSVLNNAISMQSIITAPEINYSVVSTRNQYKSFLPFIENKMNKNDRHMMVLQEKYRKMERKK
jgi:hypothetical protein